MIFDFKSYYRKGKEFVAIVAIRCELGEILRLCSVFFLATFAKKALRSQWEKPSWSLRKTKTAFAAVSSSNSPGFTSEKTSFAEW